MSPSTTVIIPTFNRADCIGAAISSVLNQTCQDFEIIIVDDASTDNTREVVEGFKESRIKYIRHKENKGDAGSRNTGIGHSRSDYIAFLDDDDEWLPEKLQIQIDCFQNNPPDVGGVYTARFQVERGCGRMTVVPSPPKDTPQLLQNNITTSSVLLRRHCFERAGLFDEGFSCASDFDMWIRISKFFRFVYVDTPLVKYYLHPNRLSTNYKKLISGEEALLKKHRLLFASNRKIHSNEYLFLGVLYCYDGDIQKGRKAFLTAINLYPFEPRHYFYLCLSLFSAENFRKIKEFKESLRIRREREVRV